MAGWVLELGSSRRPSRERGCRCLRRCAWLQPPDDFNGGRVFTSCSGSAEPPGERPGRAKMRRGDAEPPKAVGHDADDFVRSSVDNHAETDHLSIAPEQFAPSRVTQ